MRRGQSVFSLGCLVVCLVWCGEEHIVRDEAKWCEVRDPKATWRLNS